MFNFLFHMDSHEQRLEEYIQKPEKDLLRVIEYEQVSPNVDFAKSVLQVKLQQSISALNKTVEASTKETEKQNSVMINLTMVLFFVAVLQIIVPIWMSNLAQWPKAGISIVTILIIAWAFWYIFKEQKIKK